MSQLCVVLTTMFTILLSVFVMMYNHCHIVDKDECFFFPAEEESSVSDKGTIQESRYWKSLPWQY